MPAAIGGDPGGAAGGAGQTAGARDGVVVWRLCWVGLVVAWSGGEFSTGLLAWAGGPAFTECLVISLIHLKVFHHFYSFK